MRSAGEARMKMKLAETILHRMRTAICLLFFGVFFACPLPPAPCPLVGAEEFKVGYVNVPKVFDGYDRTKAYEAGLEKKGQQKETEMEGRMNELKKLRESLELLNDQARDAKVREIEEKADAIKRFRSNTARDLARERDQMAGEILKEIQTTVEEYAKTNNFSFILDERSVLFGQPTYDVTSEVLKILNSRLAANHKH